MQCLSIQGGRALSGTLRVSGAKNAVLKLMAASLMTGEECIIRNVPRITDVVCMINLVRGLGAQVHLSTEGVLRIKAGGNLSWEAPEHCVREMRASIQILGPILARLHQVRISRPGGCAIGVRPVDLHLTGLRCLGATLREEHGVISGACQRLVGGEINLDYPSVGATENLMMAAALAQGITVINNAAQEPEIIEVQNFLKLMGASIKGAGTATVTVSGVEELHGADYAVLPDRIEAGTFMVAAAITGGEITITPVVLKHVRAVVVKLREAGAEVEVQEGKVWVNGAGRLRPLQIRSAPYPGFPTDMQPQFSALLSLADGTSVISENVFSSRFKHADELARMGAKIKVDANVARITGVQHLTGARVKATDLRAGAALVLAGLVAHGITCVEGVHHLDRGYEDLETKLSGVGANIVRQETVSVGSRLTFR